MPGKKPSHPIPTPFARNRPERDVVAIGNILRRVEARKKIQEKVLRELHSRGTINEIALRRAAIKEIGRHEDYGRNLPYYSEIHLALKKFGGHLANQPVLHLASSTGIYTRFLQSLGVHAIGLDASKGYARSAHAIGNKRQVIADATKRLPFKSNSFQVVVSDHFLFSGYNQIIAHEHKMLKEITRVLKPKGVLIVSEGMLDAHEIDSLELQKMGLRVESFDPKGSHGNIILVFHKVPKEK